MFFFKKKPIEVRCFVHEEFSAAHEYARIQESRFFYPEWAKENKTGGHFSFEKMSAEPTIRHCMGFLGSFRNGFILPLWSDLAIKTASDGSWRYQFSDKISSLKRHDNDQATGFLTDYNFFKIESPWTIDCKERIQFAYSPCSWHTTNDQKYFVPSGVVNFHTNHASHIFILTKKQDDEIFINFRQPMIQYLPLTERPIKLITDVLSASEWKKVNRGYEQSFIRTGINRRLAAEGKCPISTLVRRSSELDK